VHRDNPITHTRRRIQEHPKTFMMHTSRSLLSKISSHPLYAQWFPQRRSLSLKTYLSRIITEHWQNSVLVRYISSSCRSQSGVDRCVYIVDQSTRHSAIRWRINRTLVRRHCTLCHEPFHRSHVNQCPALREAPRLQTLWDRFDHELHQRQRNGLFDNFCLLDMLLNNQDYDEFDAAVSLIERNSE
jgi:hypothetical protein